MQVLQNQGLLEAAVQATLTCDAISLRFQLPPYGTPTPEATESPDVAGGTPCTTAQLITSVWVVNVLRSIAKRSDSHLLPIIGVAAVSAQPVMGFTADDARRFQMLQRSQPLLGCIPLVRSSLLRCALLINECSSRVQAASHGAAQLQ